MNDNIAIRVEGLWKRYGLSIEPVLRRALRSLISFGRVDPRRSESDDGPWALREVSFEVRRGETLGIIGRNGAGKSTLLKVLAGVTPPTRGRVEVRGEVFPMIELNAGVHPELTGRENVYLLGAIMGLSRSKVEDVLPEIEEFIELGEWFDRPVRMYSSGMLARLGFGVATSIRSDILLIDETFSVGDLKFQNKSLARVKQMRENGATVVLVTHSLDMLQFVAQRGLVLDGGLLVAEGSALEGLGAYEKLVFRSEQACLQHRVRRRISTEEITLCNVRLYGQDGGSLLEIGAGSPFGIEVEFQVHRSLERPVFSVGILNTAGVICIWNVSEEDGFTCQRMNGRRRLRVWYPENKLMKGAYEVNFALRDGTSYETLERFAGITSFSVTSPGRGRGIMVMSPQWELTGGE
jgi:ABC-type polysaccharide/polyol phosphate transport system ATPase subunit